MSGMKDNEKSAGAFHATADDDAHFDDMDYVDDADMEGADESFFFNQRGSGSGGRRHSFTEGQFGNVSGLDGLLASGMQNPAGIEEHNANARMAVDHEMAYGMPPMGGGLDAWALPMDYGLGTNPLAAAYGMARYTLPRSPLAGGGGRLDTPAARRARMLHRTQSLTNLASAAAAGNPYFGMPSPLGAYFGSSPVSSHAFPGSNYMMPDAQMIDAAMANPYHPMSAYILSHAAAQLRASAASTKAAVVAAAAAASAASTATTASSSAGPSPSEPLSESDLKLLQETRKLVEAQQSPLTHVQSEEEAASIREHQMLTMVEAPGYAQDQRTKAAITAAAFAVLSPVSTNGRRSPSQGRSSALDDTPMSPSPSGTPRSLSRPRSRPVSQSPTRMDSDGEQRPGNSSTAGRVGIMGRSRRGSALRPRPSLTGLDMSALTAAVSGKLDSARGTDSPAGLWADHFSPITGGPEDDPYASTFAPAYAAAAAASAAASENSAAEDEGEDTAGEQVAATPGMTAAQTELVANAMNFIRRGRKLNRSIGKAGRPKAGSAAGAESDEPNQERAPDSRSSSIAPTEARTPTSVTPIRANPEMAILRTNSEVAAIMVDNAAQAIASGGTPIQSRRRKGHGVPSSIMGIIIPGGRYQCTWPNCGKTFSTSGHLSRHARIHIGFKPFECEICGAKFSRSDNMRMHQKTHGEKGTTSPAPGEEQSTVNIFADGQTDSNPASPLSPEPSSDAQLAAAAAAVIAAYPSPINTPGMSSSRGGSRVGSRRNSGNIGHSRKYSVLSNAPTTTAAEIGFSEMLMSPATDYVDDIVKAASDAAGTAYELMDPAAMALEMQIFGGLVDGDGNATFSMDDLPDLHGERGDTSIVVDATVEEKTERELLDFSSATDMMRVEDDGAEEAGRGGNARVFGRLKGFKRFGSNQALKESAAAAVAAAAAVSANSAPSSPFVGYPGQDGSDFMRSDEDGSEVKSREYYN
ncbi:transcriptional repressor [Phlyctochytrium planicorne]|nr:transcriptional repressor [Phlyctochytrium planicorne]